MHVNLFETAHCRHATVNDNDGWCEPAPQPYSITEHTNTLLTINDNQSFRSIILTTSTSGGPRTYLVSGRQSQTRELRQVETIGQNKTEDTDDDTHKTWINPHNPQHFHHRQPQMCRAGKYWRTGRSSQVNVILERMSYITLYNDTDGLGRNFSVYKSEPGCQTPVIPSSCVIIDVRKFILDT